MKSRIKGMTDDQYTEFVSANRLTFRKAVASQMVIREAPLTPKQRKARKKAYKARHRGTPYVRPTPKLGRNAVIRDGDGNRLGKAKFIEPDLITSRLRHGCARGRIRVRSKYNIERLKQAAERMVSMQEAM